MLISKSLTLSSPYRVVAMLCLALLMHGALLGAIVILSSDSKSAPKKAHPLLFVQQGHLIFEKEVVEKQQVKIQDVQSRKVKPEAHEKITHTPPRVIQKVHKEPAKKTVNKEDLKLKQKTIQQLASSVTQSPAQSSPLTSKNVTVLLPHTKATAGSNPLPAYPKLSKRLKEQGTVFISLRVLRDGSVAHVHVKKSSGFTRLDAAALKAVKDWRYTPAMKNNKPIDFDYSQPVLFALQ